MAMNLEAVLKIAAKVTGLEDLGALEKGLVGAEKAANAAKSGFGAMLNSGAWQAAAAAAAGLGVAIGLSVRAAIQFEESMAEVRKVVSGLENPKALQEIRQEIFGLAREIPITAQAFAQMYAAAGQAGIPRAELKAFATDVAKISIAFDMTAAEAGNAMAKLRTNLGLTQAELIDLADAANYLSNNMAATAAEIVQFLLRSGTAGQIAGLSAQQTAAFGAAMIASGASAEVASTSFNKMITALSRGSSMTDRQINALVRLGYGQADAASMEDQLTQAVEEESRKRLDTYRKETDGALKEINRRYRDQMQILQDGWDDELSAYEDAAGDKLQAQIRTLDRQRDAEIQASNKRAEINGTSNRNELNQINDSYDERIDALRDANSREMKDRQRQARDNQQQIKDQLDDQKELEINAVQQKYQELSVIEAARKKLAIEDAKATARAIVGELGANMAQMLQKDAVGTIRDVFARIKALPAEMQMSVITDLFGEEARALLPLIHNSGLLEQALTLVGDKSKYAGSTAEEYAARLATTASKLQLTNNRVNELSVKFGSIFRPAINLAVDALTPLVDGLIALSDRFPILTGIIGGLAFAFVGLITAAPAISGFITLMGQLGITGAKIGAIFKGLGVIWFGLKTAFLIAFQSIMSWIGGTFIPALAAFFSGPVGWTVLAVAAVVAMVVLFREPIGKFLIWLGTEFNKAMSALGKIAYDFFVQPFVDLWNNVLRAPITAALASISNEFEYAMNNLGKVAYDLFVKPWVDLWENKLRAPVPAMIGWVEKSWNDISKYFDQNVVKPIEKSWNNLLNFLPKAADGISAKINNAWKDIATFFDKNIAKLIQTAWTNLTTTLPRATVTISTNVNKAWNSIASFFANNIIKPIQTAWTNLTSFLPKAMATAAKSVQTAFTNIGTTIKSILNGVLRGIMYGVNKIINEINWLVGRANAISAQVGGPRLPILPIFSIPQFAEGGVVNGPTLAMVGEGGEPEYIIPQSKMAAASANYLNGARGGAVIPAFANGGFVGGGGNAQINVTTGPVLQQGGQQYVTMADLEKAMRKTADGVYASLRTPASRIAMGRA